MTKHVCARVIVTGVAILALAEAMTATPVLALDEVYTPNVDYRELSFEYNGSRTFDPHAGKDGAMGHELVIEAGIIPRWTVEASAGFTKDPGADTNLDHFEIESRFQFFEAGENWLDSGLLIAYDFSMKRQQADSLEVKLLLQKDFGKITSTVNVGFSNDIGHYAVSGGPDYAFLWNTRYRFNEYIQPGLEIQSDLGQARRLGHFNQQEHYIGPAVYGRLFGQLKYQVGYFVGVSDAAAQTAARVQLEYETHF